MKHPSCHDRNNRTAAHDSRVAPVRFGSPRLRLRYQVITDGKSRQRINGDDDRMTVTLGDFLKHVAGGSHQALEALWSPVADIDPRCKAWFAGLWPDLGFATSRYLGAIAHMGTRHSKTPFTDFDDVPFKIRRHMLRMAGNLSDLHEGHRFNPRLTPDQVALVDRHATSSRDEFVTALRATCPVSIELSF